MQGPGGAPVALGALHCPHWIDSVAQFQNTKIYYNMKNIFPVHAKAIIHCDLSAFEADFNKETFKIIDNLEITLCFYLFIYQTVTTQTYLLSSYYLMYILFDELL